MTDFLVQVTLSNFVVATILAVLAWSVQRRVPSASLANLLWALVLIKLVTPPIVSVPLVEIPSISRVSIPTAEPLSNNVESMNLDASDQAPVPLTSDLPKSPTSENTSWAFPIDRAWLATVTLSTWSVVSVVLLIVSALRIIRFHWLLKANSHVSPTLSAGLGDQVAGQLGLRIRPSIVVTPANIPPFVWWMSGRSIVVISQHAVDELDQEDLRLIVTHEMAHIKRRDHWFRWLEWIALIGFWWNPIMWWARKQLRIPEEAACDDLVLETASPGVGTYANSLLNMAELLTSPAIRPPVVASAINSGGSFEKRLKMMIAKKTCKVPSAVRWTVIAVAVCVFPMGFVYAQDYEAVEKRLGAAVEAGELSIEQAHLMMEALRRSKSDRRVEDQKRRYTDLSREIKEAVESGDLSKEDAEAKMRAAAQDMFGEVKERNRYEELEARKRRYVEIAREIESGVQSGRLSKEEAEEKMLAIRREMFDEERERERHAEHDEDEGHSELEEARDREREARELRFREFMVEIEGAVEAGEISKEEAEKKIMSVRRELFSAVRRMAGQEQRLDAYRREIAELVEKGELSEEEAEAKLMEVRKAMSRDERETNEGRRGERQEMEIRKRRYMEIVREIEAAVANGNFSLEDAEKRIAAARKELFGERSAEENEREMDERRAYYAQFERRIKSALENEEISYEEAEAKMIEMRKKLFENDRSKVRREREE